MIPSSSVPLLTIHATPAGHRGEDLSHIGTDGGDARTRLLNTRCAAAGKEISVGGVMALGRGHSFIDQVYDWATNDPCVQSRK